MAERAGIEAKLGFKAHPHMLRHACGFALANKGHDTRALQAFLGHRNIHHCALYRAVTRSVQRHLAVKGFKDSLRVVCVRARCVAASHQNGCPARAESSGAPAAIVLGTCSNVGALSFYEKWRCSRF
jgi:hypothetical protein